MSAANAKFPAAILGVVADDVDWTDLMVTADSLWDYLRQMEGVWFFPDPNRPLDVDPFTLQPAGDSLLVITESERAIAHLHKPDFLAAADSTTIVEPDTRPWYARVVLNQLFGEIASWHVPKTWEELETQAMGYLIPQSGSWEAAVLAYLEAGTTEALRPFMDSNAEPHFAYLAKLMMLLGASDYEEALQVELETGRVSLATLVWYKRKLQWPFLRAHEMLALTEVRDALTTFGKDQLRSVQTHLESLLDEMAGNGEPDPLRHMVSRFAKGNLTAVRLRRLLGEVDDFRATQDIERWSASSMGQPLAEEWENPVVSLPRYRLPSEPPLKGHVNLNFCLVLAINSRLGELARAAEDRYRRAASLPPIGGGWVTQHILYHRLREAHPTEKIVAEASPEWLGRQRLDIFFPERNIAIEYNGLQHYEAVEFFGGDEALDATQRRDALKRRLCAENDCELVEIRYDVSIENAVDMVSDSLQRMAK